MFLRNLELEGMTISSHSKHLDNGLNLSFDLITAGDKMLWTYAEIMQLRMPLKRDSKVENLEKIKPKHGFHVLAWMHHMLKENYPEFIQIFTPSMPTLKVLYFIFKFIITFIIYFLCFRMFYMANSQYMNIYT